jgi:hypothetical protein
MVSDQTMRAGIKWIQRNAETVPHALQCGTRLAARLNERSADQFSRAIGISGRSAGEAARTSARNVQAIMQSSAVLTEISRRLCEEGVDIAGRAWSGRSIASMCSCSAARRRTSPRCGASSCATTWRPSWTMRKRSRHMARLAREARQSGNVAVTAERRERIYIRRAGSESQSGRHSRIATPSPGSACLSPALSAPFTVPVRE